MKSIEDVLRTLDAIEADLRRLESRLLSARSALRERVDPFKRRSDIGYFYDETRDGKAATK